MSPLFGRRPATRPEYLTPPDPQAAIAEIDRKLLSIALIPAEHRTDVQHGFADRLLDQRNAVRAGAPAEVPVIPGRAS